MTCAYGVHILGRVFIVYGVCDALASVGFGFVIKKTGRLPIFLLGAGINVSVLLTLWAWSPQGDDVHIVYILASLWGVADAIWQTQINALHGVLFPEDSEAAFSNYRQVSHLVEVEKLVEYIVGEQILKQPQALCRKAETIQL